MKDLSRTRGAAFCAQLLARMYGYTEVPPATAWKIVPHVTERMTFGVIDRTTGTAWDSATPVDDDVLAWGLEGPCSSADVHADMPPGEGQPTAMVAPPGWMKIGLPDWRGYFRDGPYISVPAEHCAPERFIRPRLRAVGLMTSHGSPGAPRRTLADVVEKNQYPHGLPGWVYPGEECSTIKWLPLDVDQRRDVQAVAADFLRDGIRYATRLSRWQPELERVLEAGDREALLSLCMVNNSQCSSQGDINSFWPAFGRSQDTVRAILTPDWGVRWAAAILADTRGEDVPGGRLADIVVYAVERVLAEATTDARQSTAAMIARVAALTGIDPLGPQQEVLPQIVRTAAKVILAGCALSRATLVRSVCTVLYRHGPILLDVSALDARLLQ